MKDKATQRALERLVNAVDALTEEVQEMHEVMERIAATQQGGEAAQKAKQTEEQSGKAADQSGKAADQSGKAADQQGDDATEQRGYRVSRRYGYLTWLVEQAVQSGRVYMVVNDVPGSRRSTRNFADALRKALKRSERGGDFEVEQKGDKVLLTNRYVVEHLGKLAAQYPDKEEFREFLKQNEWENYARELGLI